jgi:hypothetical protein
MATKPTDQYSEKEASTRFEAALRGALNTPHKPAEGNMGTPSSRPG